MEACFEAAGVPPEFWFWFWFWLLGPVAPLLALEFADCDELTCCASAEDRPACAERSCASACSRVSSALRGSVVASSWPSTTCWPALTFTSVSRPALAKLTSVCRAWIVPLPDTVDCTTPRSAVTVRDLAAGALSGPTTRTAATTAPAHSRVRTTHVQRGLLVARRIRRQSYGSYGRAALEEPKTFVRNVRQLGLTAANRRWAASSVGRLPAQAGLPASLPSLVFASQAATLLNRTCA